jgi:hypothetical protein
MITSMTNKFGQIRQLKDAFEFNLDDVSSDKFETTKGLLNDFKSIFNVKALAVATLMGFSSGAIAADPLPLSKIQETFNQSIRMINSNYNENLPTYFENKNSIKDDTILKNEFWKGSVATLIIDDMNPEMTDSRYAEQARVMSDNSGISLYVSQFAKNALSVKKDISPEEYYHSVSEYKHYFRNDQSSISLQDFKSKIKPENRLYFDDFITYHEMAHSSFEQESSRLNKSATFTLNSPLRLESHSDIASLFMVSNKYGLSFNQFKSLASDIIEARSLYAGVARDFNHNTSVVLSELVHTLENNQNIYNNMSNEKISAFTGYFVHEFYEQDPKKLFKKLESEKIPTSINGFLEGMETFREGLRKIDREHGSIVTSNIDVGAAPFYMVMFEDIYFSRNPEKLKEFNEAVSTDSVMNAAAIKINAYKDIMNQSNSEKEIYAVAAYNTMKNLTVENYTQYLSSFYNPNAIMKVHNQSVLSDTFKIHADEVNKEISVDNKVKRKI